MAVLASALAALHEYTEARSPLTRPPRRYEIAVQLHNLADVEHATGRLAEAQDQYRQALSLEEELLGTNHPEVGLVANNLGTLLRELGRHNEAADCHRRALRIAEQAYPPSHPVVASIRHNLDNSVG
jgi:tetratricopeptide (TPR) repeat protein